MILSKAFLSSQTGSKLTNSLARGRGYLTKFKTGWLRSEVQPLTLFYTILIEKAGTPFIYLAFM